MHLTNKSCFFFLLLISLTLDLGFAFHLSDVQIKLIKVVDGLYMLRGEGGNIGLFIGDDSTFIIDDQFAPLNDQIKKIIRTVTSHPVKFVVNTHWHGDHTGGNEKFGMAGALILAHENVRKRMSVEQFVDTPPFNQLFPASSKAALPIVTFTKSLTFHLNGEQIRVYHVDRAHTDGDSIIQFQNANVFHMGDLFFNGSYPFIDISTGGSLTGMIEAVEGVLVLLNEDSKIIPGHGNLAQKSHLKIYLNVLRTAQKRVTILISQGKSLEQIQANRPMKEYDASWGSGFINPLTFLSIVYSSLQTEK